MEAMEIYFHGHPGNPEERIPQDRLSNWWADRTLNPSGFATGKLSASVAHAEFI
jgi:hypothetical protein